MAGVAAGEGPALACRVRPDDSNRLRLGTDDTICPGTPASSPEREHTMRHKRSIPNRGFRVADQIQRDVAELIRDLKDPRIGMVTIHAVEVTPDYAHATVFFSVLIGDAQECEIALNEAAGFIRNGLFKRLQIHTVPTLHFKFDRTTERAAELNALIKEANANRAAED
jgi:ribosome-binding factor A